ncbi:CD63 protein, partial [Onychorhynchus coronatus]|nr:CD63 protein [Onychorhynchus coronatus]
MAVEGGMKCVKFLVFFFNFIFWVCGVALIAIGIYAQVALGKVLVVSSGSSAGTPVAILVLGVIIFFISFFGCCGAWKESYCMVTTVSSVLKEGLQEAMNKYGEDPVVTEALDKLQRDVSIGVRVPGGYPAPPDRLSPQFSCCGAINYTDWATIKPFQANDTVPRSCCRNTTITTCNVHPNPETVYAKGCLQGIEGWMKTNILVVAAVALGIAFFEILGIIFACCLMRGIRSGYEVM